MPVGNTNLSHMGLSDNLQSKTVKNRILPNTRSSLHKNIMRLVFRSLWTPTFQTGRMVRPDISDISFNFIQANEEYYEAKLSTARNFFKMAGNVYFFTKMTDETGTESLTDGRMVRLP